MLSGSEVDKEEATETCWAREDLAANATRSTAGLRAAVSDVGGAVGARAVDQAACAPGTVVEVVETEERRLWPREVCLFLLREAVRKCLVDLESRVIWSREIGAPGPTGGGSSPEVGC